MTTEAARQYVVTLHGVTSRLSAAEVAALLESEANRDARIYRVHNVYPDGRMELVGVSAERFQLEDCFLFYRSDEPAARQDFDELIRLAGEQAPPCRARWQLARMPALNGPLVCALIYPAEFSDDMSAWLQKIGYHGGDVVEGGPTLVAGYHADAPQVLDRTQFWGALDGTITAGQPARRAAGL